MIDIIICFGHREIYPGDPILFGSRDSELPKMYDLEDRLDMIDLDWQSVDIDRYRTQLLQTRNARVEPLRYVVLPDLLDSGKLDSTLAFGQELIDADVMHTALLPVKCNIDMNSLPIWVRPAMPIDSNYGNKLREDYTLDSFSEYRGKIHTLEGPDFVQIFQFMDRYAPVTELGSMDMNSICSRARWGRWLDKNGSKWWDSNLGFYGSINRSIESIKVIHGVLNSDNRSTANELYRKLRKRKQIAKYF